MKSTQMNHVLGITDKRAEEIMKEVAEALIKAGKVDEGTRWLMEKYDAESMLAGMRLMTLVQMHNSITEGKQKIQKPNLN